MAINGNANGIPFLKSNVIPPAIRNSMILWYDLKKQGATNESMAENPILKDLSGNGHDATCYNFAWSGMSGVGGYITFNTGGDFNGLVSFKDYRKIIITRSASATQSCYESEIPANSQIPSYKIKITGITDSGMTLNGRYGYQSLSITQDGDYLLPAVSNTNEEVIYTSFYLTPYDTECNITIEQLPLYPNALVSDGVDNYCLVEGLPLLNKEDGYTVIAKRQFLANKGCLASNRDIGTVHGAFAFEINELSRTDSFGALNYVDIEQSSITYQTKSYYNGESINNGEYNSVDTVVLFNLSANNTYFVQCALYSFLLFNRDLTPEEIEWVKTNLIETEQ